MRLPFRIQGDTSPCFNGAPGRRAAPFPERPPPVPHHPDWRQELRRRLVTLWPAKAVGTPLGITLFFMGYFWVMRHPLGPVFTMPLVWADHAVPFWPETFAAYVSLWVYVALAPAVAGDRRELEACTLPMLFMSIVGFMLFLAFPTQVPKADVDWTLHTAMQFLKQVDASGNACPSLHVAFAVYTAWVLDRTFAAIRGPASFRWANALWCLAIVHSTLATRQHVALDVLAGIVLAVAAAALHQALMAAGARRAVGPAAA